MRYAIIDGDIVAFLASAVEPDDSIKAKKRADELVVDICESCFADDYLLYVKGPNNFRDNYDTYKRNRSGGERPSSLESVRTHLANVHGMRAPAGEADDICVIQAQDFLDDGVDYVICSIDKDLRQMPGLHYNIRKNEITRVEEQEGFRFLMLQCLTGDRVDGIDGIRGIGPVKGNKILDEAEDLYEAVGRAWAAKYPDDWKEGLAKCYNLVYMRRRKDELRILPLPEEFYAWEKEA